MTDLEQPAIFNVSDSQVRHVAFLDILGFSAKVLSDFQGTVALYTELVKRWHTLTRANAYLQVQLTIYSDSIILICEELPPLLQAITSLYMITMSLSCMLRGGWTPCILFI
jgi:hypothetical protein